MNPSTLIRETPTLVPQPEAISHGDAVDFAVVIPAFNEEHGISQTVERVRAVLANEPYSFEIVIVDDGSTDATAEKAEATGARVVRLPENRGYGAALKAGIAASSSEFVLIIDADGTYPAEAIPALIAEAGESDMVVGARAGNSAGIPLLRRPAKWFLNRLASYLAGRRIPDLNSGLRVMRRSVLERFLPLLPSGFSFTTTVTLAMLCTGKRVVYKRIEYHRRIGSSKIRARDFVNFTVLVLRTIVLFNPLKIFLPLGTVLFGLGTAKFVYDMFLLNLSESAVMAILAAIIVWSVGMLADMIARFQLHFPADSRTP